MGSEPTVYACLAANIEKNDNELYNYSHTWRLIRTVAEGIELPEQVDALKKMECDYVQGLIFYRPLTPEAFQALLTERKDSEEHEQQ